MKIFTCFLFLLAANVLSAQTTVEIPVPEKKSFENVLYKITRNQDSLKLDVYLPESKAEKSGFPVLMIIHGGAWVEGDKSLDSVYYMRKLREEALNNDFAVVSINYSLLGKDIHFPAPVLDCKDAVRWVRANAGIYNFDSENIGLWGSSAGAHLAMLVGYTDDSLWKDTTNLESYSSEVNYVINNFGPGDLNSLLKTDASFFTIFVFKNFIRKLYDMRNNLILGMTGTSLKENEVLVKETLDLYSPIRYARTKTVPTIIFHGNKDKVVPFKESKTLHKKLNKLQAESELVKIKKGDHGFNEIPDEEVDEIVRRTIEFMKSQLN